MGWATGIMVYFVIWWILLFAILPLGVRRIDNPGRGQDRGAPENPQILRKVLITTAVAAIVWIAFYILQQADIFNFRHWAETY